MFLWNTMKRQRIALHLYDKSQPSLFESLELCNAVAPVAYCGHTKLSRVHSHMHIGRIEADAWTQSYLLCLFTH